MRLLEHTYQVNNSGLGDVRIFSDRPFGYKRYHVDWGNGRETMYSGIWYKLSKVKTLVEQELYGETTT
tara:strand:+ start:914 stop:1117 length:204 start_codon:yes stop_codon:yes gene_type:complete